LAHRMLKVGFQRDEGEPEWVEIASDGELAPFVECARVEGAIPGELRTAGDIVAREIKIPLPARLDRGKGKIEGRALLVVRLADEESRDRLLNHVALYRGSGMVTRYWNRK